MSFNFLKERQEFKKLLSELKKERRPIKISGICDAAKAYFFVTLALESKRTIIFIRPQSKSISKFEEECRFFFSEFFPEEEAFSLPPLCENPYIEITPSLESISSRMKFFHRLLNKPPLFLVSNLPGLLRPFPHPRVLKELFLEIEVGDRLERDFLLQKLSEFGYTKESIVNFRGEYAWRGGIVDVFSPWEQNPLRIEFGATQILSLREFDTSSQRSLRRIPRLILPSLREFQYSSEFKEEWARIFGEKAREIDSREIEEQISNIEEDLPATFFHLSLLNRKYFSSFNNYFADCVYVIEDEEEVEREWQETLSELRSNFQKLKEGEKFFLTPEEIFNPLLWEEIKKEAIILEEWDVSKEKDAFSFVFQSVPRFDNKLPFFLSYLRKLQEEGERIYIFFSKDVVREKMAALFSQHQIPFRLLNSPFETTHDDSVILILGGLLRGFSYLPEKLTFFSEKDIFTEERVIVSRPSLKPSIFHFQDLSSGDYVVHADYGIGIFKGLVKLEFEGKSREFIEIAYKDDDKLYVPVEDLNLVQKYSNLASSPPVLHKLGSPLWEKIKARTKKAIENMARELLQLYAQRKAIKGISYSPDGEWLHEFEKTFEYQETEDQLRAIQEVMKDMESESPMDRLLCGDVGYGKTEVAMRASFKAVMDGKQVAVLCPTTVLASQHLKTFRSRMILFPVRIEGLSRFQSKKEQKKILEDLKKGLIDILIGTHRILSDDVKFHDLGLLIIDEEQRFGVKHKEKIKQLKANIDVLTMSATPIPRTLNLSLTGLRDMSLIETPPRDRLAVHTVVTYFSPKLVASAIKFELARNGQVYYVHNRIEDIEDVARMVKRLVPQARVTVVHGKMPSTQLEKRMIDFINHRYDILVSTTIIENGIDIPLVNTLIVDRADLYGLAQLYQLRGRVGRSSRQAFAYFLVPPLRELSPMARERLKALKEFSELGSGFRLAAKDLEIRGAGSFLGSRQHGYIEAVGFDYYLHLLEQTIKELKGEAQEEIHTSINLKVDIRIPEDYLPQINLRLNLYKRISSVESVEEIDKIREEIEDRFGELPQSVENLLSYGKIKFLAQRAGINSIDRISDRLIIKFFSSSRFDIKRLLRLIEKHRGSLTPQGVLTLKLENEGEKRILDETISLLKELSFM